MKKITLILGLVFTLNSYGFEKLEKLTLSGPMASVSHPFMHIIESGALDDVAKKIEFRLWKNPDELRALTINSSVDFVAVPSNVGANLYNKGADIKLVNISIWGILGMLTRDKSLKTLSDFKGKEIIIPFRSDMPDIVFTQLAKAQGIDPKKDFDLKYVSSPINAMKMLIMRRADHALLAEPAISIALRKTNSFPLKLIAPDLYRGPDLQKEWAKVFKVEAKMPQAGIAVIGDMINNDFVIKRFNEEYNKSMQWYKNNPQKAGEMAVKAIPMLEAQGVADSIKHVQLDVVSAKNARKELESFYTMLLNSNKKTIGGKLPDDGFYY